MSVTSRNHRDFFRAGTGLLQLCALLYSGPVFASTLPSAPQPTPIKLSVTSWSIVYPQGDAQSRLSWTSKPEPVEIGTLNSKPSYLAKLSGILKNRKQVSMLVDLQPVAVASDGSFKFDLPVEEKDKVSTLTLIDGKGNIEKQILRLKFTPKIIPIAIIAVATPAPVARPSPTPGPSPKPIAPPPSPVVRVIEKSNYSSAAGVSLTSLQYEQTGISRFSEYAISGKLAVNYAKLRSRWMYSGSIFFTGVPLNSTSSQKVTLSFFGFNARVGYELPWPRKPWKMVVWTGLYFTSATARASSEFDRNLGYSVSGLQTFVSLSRTYRRGDSLGGYFKFSPLSDGFSFSTASAEFAAGLSYAFVPSVENRGFALNFDYSTSNLVLGELTVKTNSLSFGVSYRF